MVTFGEMEGPSGHDPDTSAIAEVYVTDETMILDIKRRLSNEGVDHHIMVDSDTVETAVMWRGVSFTGARALEEFFEQSPWRSDD